MQQPTDKPIEIKPGTWWLVGGETITNTHDARVCRGSEHCILHNPSAHHMRGWTQHLSQVTINDKLIPFMWRACSHGMYHPDPDEGFGRTGFNGNHLETCDGCCAPKPLTDEQLADIRAGLKEMGEDLARGIPSEDGGDLHDHSNSDP